MKKMKFVEMNEVMVRVMNFRNMFDYLEANYDMEVASDMVRAEGWDEWIDQGQAYFWIDGERVPANQYAMEWAIEELVQLETADDFEVNEYEELNYYYDAQQMQYMV